MSTEVRDAIRRLFAAGFSVDQISRTVSLPTYDVESVR